MTDIRKESRPLCFCSGPTSLC